MAERDEVQQFIAESIGDFKLACLRLLNAIGYPVSDFRAFSEQLRKEAGEDEEKIDAARMITETLGVLDMPLLSSRGAMEKFDAHSRSACVPPTMPIRMVPWALQEGRIGGDLVGTWRGIILPTGLVSTEIIVVLTPTTSPTVYGGSIVHITPSGPANYFAFLQPSGQVQAVAEPATGDAPPREIRIFVFGASANHQIDLTFQGVIANSNFIAGTVTSSTLLAGRIMSAPFHLTRTGE